MKKTTQKIITLLEKGLSQRKIATMGYPLSTVRYNARKLNNPKAHEKFLKKFAKYRLERKGSK